MLTMLTTFEMLTAVCKAALGEIKTTACLGAADCFPQSRQSAKRFSSRWNWDSPTPLAAGECAPPPFGPGGRADSLAAKGVGESQFQRRDIHCGALYI
jgi:hypothetical protein